MVNLIIGNCLDVLETIPSDSIQMCVTSPPYWKLRDYDNIEQLGSELTPEEFCEKLVLIFNSVRRVLKPDGTLWLNIGDSYCGGGGYCPNAPSNLAGSIQSSSRSAPFKRPVPQGYKPKDLAGVPWLVANALRKDGWYLRQDIIWEKTRSLPENVTDRPTRCHEYIFLLSKSKKYKYNQIMVPALEGGEKNCRSIWRMSTSSRKGSHHATFPESLPERCILAGSDENDTVLDPFVGSGTTCLVAEKNSRNSVGIELNETYAKEAQARINKIVENSCELLYNQASSP